MGGNTFTFTGLNNNTGTASFDISSNPQVLASWIPESPKCKCPNPKHTQGCSIASEDEYCKWCKVGCRKRVQAVHIRYE